MSSLPQAGVGPQENGQGWLTPERLGRHLAYYIFARLMVVTVLLLIPWTLGLSPDQWLSVGTDDYRKLAILTYVVMGLSSIGLINARAPRRIAALQIPADLGIITALVVLGGGVGSLFTGFFVLSVVASAFLFERSGTLVTAALYSAVIIALAVVEGLGLVSLLVSPRDLEAFVSATLVRVFAVFLAAFLAGRLTQELRSAGLQLASARQDLAQVITGLHTGLALLNSDGTLREGNTQARLFFPELERRSAEQVVPGFSTDQDAWETQVVSPAGLRDLFMTRTSLEGGGAVLFIEDVTRLREMERRERRQERVTAVGRLAAGIAHEVRNPLASLSGAVQMLDVNKADQPLRAIILREVDRLDRLVNNFLESAEPPSPQLTSTDFGQLVAQVIDTFEHDGRYRGAVDVRVEGSAEQPIEVDGDQLRQVLWNLLLNAAQAMPDGGEVLIRMAQGADWLTVQISDRGLGMSESELGQIFDPFYTTRAGGTGIGLSTVARLVHAHQGSVDVRSTRGEGTIFTLRLPMHAPASNRDTPHV